MFIFMAVTMPSFLSYLNITNLLKQNAVNFVLGAAMTSVLIMGEIDISVGAVVGLTVTAAGTLCAHGFSLIECLLACIFIGLFVGLINGLLITRGGLPSFIATLGTQMMCRSLAYVLTGGKVITTFPEGWTWIGQETILGNFPISFFFVILLYIITYIMIRNALNLSHIDAYWQNFVIGAVIVAAVLLDCFRQRLQMKMEV